MFRSPSAPPCVGASFIHFSLQEAVMSMTRTVALSLLLLSNVHAAAPDAVQTALAAPDRFAGDREEDAWRKSAQVLALLDLKPGMHVIDYLAGGGYNTELLSRIVGPSGRVYAYNNPPYAKYAGDTPAKRYANHRLLNVVEVGGAPETLDLPPHSLDAALFVQSYHDLHWRPKDGSWNTDPAKSLAQLAKAMKPGATVVVVDHVAAAGSDPAASVDALHRIVPAVLRKDFEAAGFRFDSSSDVLRNPADDHTKAVFDPAVRHHTDQVVYVFRMK
jgi:predicted methyltransferase